MATKKITLTSNPQAKTYGSLPRILDVYGNVFAMNASGVFQSNELSATIGSKWDETERPGMKPILRYNGGKLRTLSYKIKLGSQNWRTSVESRVKWLVSRSELKRRIRFAGTGSSTLEMGRWWHILDCTVDVTQRTPSGAVSRADVTLALTEASWVPATAKAKKKKAKKKKSKRSKKKASKAALKKGKKRRTYKVKKGDTLWSISKKYYKKGSLWRKIARANSIKHPRKLQIGKKLVIP